MYNFTIELFGDTHKTIHTNDFLEAVTALYKGRETHVKGYAVDNRAAEIFADFGYDVD